ncbi:MAG: type II toxin-antitoxin system PemK/MazF family toxin [Anaerolineae bacterium]|nr:type II toxin-antitoxin system PemK/MazF family toxin [Anaerolineae bacterium]
MERGEVRWCLFAPPDKERPGLILTRTSSIHYLNSVTIAPISTSIRPVPSQVILSVDDGLLTDCSVNLYNIQTLPRKNIGRYITTLSPARMREVEAAIRFALGLDGEP